MNNDIHVRDWMSTCPYVQSNNVGRTGSLEYGIYPSPVTTRYRLNVLGERMPSDRQEMNFIFTAKRRYNERNSSVVSNYQFYQNILTWIEQQDKDANFPYINEGQVVSVTPRLTQYVSEPNKGEERCEFEINIAYIKRPI